MDYHNLLEYRELPWRPTCSLLGSILASGNIGIHYLECHYRYDCLEWCSSGHFVGWLFDCFVSPRHGCLSDLWFGLFQGPDRRTARLSAPDWELARSLCNSGRWFDTGPSRTVLEPSSTYHQLGSSSIWRTTTWQLGSGTRNSNEWWRVFPKYYIWCQQWEYSATSKWIFLFFLSFVGFGRHYSFSSSPPFGTTAGRHFRISYRPNLGLVGTIKCLHPQLSTDRPTNYQSSTTLHP